MSTVLYHRPETRISGTVCLPSSKSVAHRSILAAALSRGNCKVIGVDENADMWATLNAVKALGIQAEFKTDEKEVVFSEVLTFSQEMKEVNCGESGSTLRFVIPIFAALGMSARFIGAGRLPQRPIGIYQDLLTGHGVRVKTEGGLPFEISGQLRGGIYTLPGNVSSQFITGLLLALPLLKEDSQIILSSALESSGYVDLTLQTLKEFGIKITTTEVGWNIPGGQQYQPKSTEVEGDWSHAAFFLSLAAVSASGTILLKGLKQDSLQGDIACVSLYRKFGLDVRFTPEGLMACNPNGNKEYRGLRALEIDAAQIPDMVPALAMCGVFARGTTRIYNAGRLRLKESDRLEAMADAINRLGGKAHLSENEIFVDGVNRLRGGKALGVNDHRIVMALSSAGIDSIDPVRVTDAQSINKSYPGFFADYSNLGGNVNVIDMG